MATQTIFWTALPNGGEGSQVRLSVHVAPRLVATGGGPTTLATFDDFANWPNTLASFSWSVHFPTLAWTLPATATSTPDPALWAALFPPATTVRSHVFKAFNTAKIRSYNVKHVVGFLQEQYAKFADIAAENYPSWEEIAGDDALGPAGFSARGDVPEIGIERRARLSEDLEGELTANKAVPYSVAAPATPDEIGKQFLQLETFLKPRGKVLLGTIPRPVPDFHDVLAFVLQHPPLLRLLGLVVDLVVDTPIDPGGTPLDATVEVLAPWTASSPTETATRRDVTPQTHCKFAPPVFETSPRDPASSVFERGHAWLADEDRFDVVVVEPDGAGLKAMMLADNLQRARPDLNPLKKLSLASPTNYALPSLRSSGISVAQLGIAPHFVIAMESGSDLNASAVDSNGVPQPAHPHIYLEDIVRGYRFDVHDGLPDEPSPLGWRTLMARIGTYKFLNAPGQTTVDFDDEGTFTAAPTGAADHSSTDLYLQESLMRWDGWSLVASRPGKTISPTDQLETSDNTSESEFGLEIRPKAKPGSLPRLRFGHIYLVRARVVDLAGNSVPFDQGAGARDEELVTAPEMFTRFEPVAQPTLLLRAVRIEGESPEIVVIRSENAADDPGPLVVDESDRHVMPPRTSELTAEHHGLFDDGAYGSITKLTHAQIAALDAGTLEGHPAAVPEPGGPVVDGAPTTFIYPTSPLALNYMPDVLARKAVLRGLPATAPTPLDDGTTASVPFEPDPLFDGPRWPGYRPFRIATTKAPTASSWQFFEVADRFLNVSLVKSDVFDVRISCGGMTDDDVDVMGQWQWLVNRLGAANPSLEGRRRHVQAGRHWMFTPYRDVKFVHAVRTPLASPEFPQLSVSKVLGDTFATLQRELTFHRQSTVSIDVDGAWQMPIDTGPRPRNPTTGAPVPLTVENNPVPPRNFRSHAFTLPIESRNGQPGVLDLNNRHEFGDTKYRLVAYQATATSSFTEYFTEHRAGLPMTSGPVSVAPQLEESAVVVRKSGPGGQTYRRGPEGDFVVNESAGTITRVGNGIPVGHPCRRRLRAA